MKKSLFLFLFAASFVMLSHVAFAQEVTVTLQPGWTWIGYPGSETVDIAAALGDFAPEEGDVIKSQSIYTMYQEGEWSGDLTQFTPGMGYMFFSNRTEPVDIVFGNVHPQLSMTLDYPSEVTATTATCSGTVSPEAGSNLRVILKGICWGLNPSPTLNDNYLEVGNEAGQFAGTMTELAPVTMYYARTFVVTPMGIYYSSQQSFTTLQMIYVPTVTTNSVSDILSNTATCGGDVTSDGNGTVTARGVCWNTSDNPTIANNHTVDGSGTGSFTSTITGLSPVTTYYVRAYATNEVGTAYGPSMTFTTSVALPTVTTATLFDIGPTSAFGGGNVTNAGGGTVTARGVCWSTSGNIPTIADSHTVDGSGTGSFYSIITALTPGTTYYIRAYATNEAGTNYGIIRTFSTLANSDSSVGIIAHRGFYKFANASGTVVAIPQSAENSIYAVRAAIDLDFEGTEFDVQITKDNQLIVFHNLKMNSNLIYNTNYSTLQTLSEFTLANGETVPKLTTFLNNCRNRLQAQEQRLGERHTKLVVEIKTHANMAEKQVDTLVNRTIRYIRNYNLQNDVFFISFNMSVCQKLTERMPGAPVAYLSSVSTNNSGSSPAYSPLDLLGNFGIPHIDYEYKLFQSNYYPEWVQQAHNLGMTVNAWTVDTKTIANSMRTLGVDFITTNVPLNIRAWFAESQNR